MKAIACVLVSVLPASMAAGDVLFDNGVRMIGGNIAEIYHPVTAAPDGSGFDTYQPFSVTDAGGWSVDTIGFFGRRDENHGVDANGLMHVLLYAWTGSVDTLGSAIAGANIAFADVSDPDTGPIWVTESFGGLNLAAGDYVIRAQGLDSFSEVAWHHGETGPNAIGVQLSDGQAFPRGASAAVRINGTVIPAPAGSLVLLSLATAARRRRPVR